MTSLNGGIYNFRNFRPNAELQKNLKQKPEDNSNGVADPKVAEAQEQDGSNVVSSTKVLKELEELAAIQRGAVKTQAPENVAPKQNASGARTETTEELDENGNKIVITKKYDNAGRLVSETYYKNGVLEKE